MADKNSITICGAGIAGIATAYYLLKQNSALKVTIIDKHQALSFTTSKSGENYRDYWPQTCMRQFVSHSISLMKQIRDEYGAAAFEMSHTGYNFVSHHADNPIFGVNLKDDMGAYLEEIKDPAIIKSDFSYLDQAIKKILRVKNAGKIDVYAMGSLMLKAAMKRGLKFITGEIIDIKPSEAGYQVYLDDNRSHQSNKIVIATGPFINNLAGMLGIQFPITNTVQRKIIIPDPKSIIPKSMPFTIYADAQYLKWSDEELKILKANPSDHWLLNEFPGGLHIRPDVAGLKLGWAFQTDDHVADWTIPNLDIFPQIILKGVSRFIPNLSVYQDNIPTPIIEYGGHYTRTKENWPLIGPTSLDRVYVIGAMAGYGTMSACAAGELCSDYILQKQTLPEYAPYFHPQRYDDPVIRHEMSELKSDGQL